MTTWEQKRDSSPLRGSLAPYDGLLRVTPGFPGTCQGRVHSVFHRVINVEMQSEGTVACLCWLLRKCLPCRTAYAFRRSFYRPSRWGRR